MEILKQILKDNLEISQIESFIIVDEGYDSKTVASKDLNSIVFHMTKNINSILRQTCHFLEDFNQDKIKTLKITGDYHSIIINSIYKNHYLIAYFKTLSSEGTANYYINKTIYDLENAYLTNKSISSSKQNSNPTQKETLKELSSINS